MPCQTEPLKPQPWTKTSSGPLVPEYKAQREAMPEDIQQAVHVGFAVASGEREPKS